MSRNRRAQSAGRRTASRNRGALSVGPVAQGRNRSAQGGDPTPRSIPAAIRDSQAVGPTTMPAER